MTTPQSLKLSTRQGVGSKAGPQLAGEMKKVGNFSTKGPSIVYPATRLTQEDQDKADDEKEREAMRALVQTWQDNLQLISVITTFFVSTEASLLGITIPSLKEDGQSPEGQLANACLMSALMIHAHAAVIAFLAAFFLVRYKLSVAQKEEAAVEHELTESPTSIPGWDDPEKAKGRQNFPHAYHLQVRRGRVRVNSPFSGDRVIWSTDPHLVQVGPFQGQPQIKVTQLLTRCHSLCIFLSFVGFLLTFTGALSYAWDRLPRSVSIPTSTATGLCLVAAIMTLLTPSSSHHPHFFCNYKFR